MSKKTNWGDVVRGTINDIICAIKTTPKNPHTPNPTARLCVLILIGITLLFSGIGIYSWIIIIMLLIILKFI